MARTGSKTRVKKRGKRVTPDTIAESREGPTAAEANGRPRRPAKRKARTASGKKADSGTLAAAARHSQEGLRERTEAGHRAAGRTPPSQVSDKRVSGATRVIDDDIRSYAGLITEDQKLLETPAGTRRMGE